MRTIVCSLLIGFAVANPVGRAWAQEESAAAAQAYNAVAALQNGGKYDPAAEAWAKFLAEHPDSKLVPDAMFHRGECLYHGGKKKEAAEQCAQLLARFPKDATAAEALYALGVAQEELGQHAEAAQSLDQFLQKHPTSPLAADATMRQAAILARNKKYAEAAIRYASVATQWPKSDLASKANLETAKCYYLAADYPTALDRATSFLTAYPKDDSAADAMSIAAESRLQLGQFSDAERLFDELLQKYPHHADASAWKQRRGWAVYMQADAYKDPKDSDKVKAVLARLIADSPDSPLLDRAHFRLAELAYAAGKFDEAIAEYRQVVDHWPKSPLVPNALYGLGWALAQQDKTKESAEAFTRLAKEHPQSPLAAEALYDVGESAFKAGNYKKAAVAYHQAWQKAGKNELGEKAAHKLAWSFFRLNNYPSAQQTFHYEYVTWPNGPLAADAAFMEGESLLVQKKPVEALASYEKTIAASDGETAARAQFQIGRIRFDRKDYENAKKTFVKVASTYSFPRWQAEAMYEAGRCCEALGERDAAIRQYSELVQKFPHSDKSPPAKQRIEELRK